MGKPKKELVWKHYRRCEDSGVICSFCNHKYKIANVNKMENHLKKCFLCPEQYKNSIKELNKENDNPSAETSKIDIENTQSNTTSAVSNLSSTSLPAFEDKFSENQINTLHSELAKAIYVSGSPFSMVEHPLWIDFFKRLQPLYKLPSRKAISTTHLEKTYRKMHTELMDELKAQSYLHLQCDGWSDLRNRGIMNFIISKPEPMFVKSLDTESNRHTGEYISNEILKIIEDYGAQKFFVLIGDNATNMQRAFRLVKAIHPHITPLNCAAHVLNRLCEDILQLEALKTFIFKAINCIKAVKKSQVACALLADIVKEKGVGETLKLPCNTRWGSHFTGLRSLENTKIALQTLAVHERSPLSNNTKAAFLDQTFWKLTRECNLLLKPITEAITTLEGDKEIIHKVYLCLRDVKSKLEFVLPEMTILNEEEKQNILTFTENRMKMCIKPIHLAAYLLNPALRGAELKRHEIQDAAGYILDVGSNLGLDIVQELAEYRAKSGYWACSHVWRNINKIAPVLWWSGVCEPTHLSHVALRILTAPCTSAATERSFSCQGNIHSKKRNRLTSDRTGKIAFITYNWNIHQRKEKANFDDGDESPSITEENSPISRPSTSSGIMHSPTRAEIEFRDCGNLEAVGSSISSDTSD